MTREKKKRSLLFKILVGVMSFAALAIMIVLVLGFSLLGRIQKAGTFDFGSDEEQSVNTPLPDDFDPEINKPAGVTLAPALTPTPAPMEPAEEEALEQTEEPAVISDLPLPLEDLYPQTKLSAAQIAAIQAQNANTQDYISILLVGVDRRGTTGRANADTVMIATMDKRNGRLKLTSLLRDLYVPIPDAANGRLNSATAKGGMAGLMKTVNDALQMDIENYVLVDFSMFEKIINKLGGVTVFMSAAEISAANDNIAGLNRQRGVSDLWSGFIFANAGNVGLNGKQALGYARIRKIDSDFKRTNRQFTLLNAIFAKFRSKNAIEQYDLIASVLPMVETDLSGTQMLEYAVAALSMDVGGLMHETVPIDGLYESGRVAGSSVLLFDMPATAWRVHSFIYNHIGVPETAQVLSPGRSLPPRTPNPTPSLVPEEELTDTVVPEGERWTNPFKDREE